MNLDVDMRVDNINVGKAQSGDALSVDFVNGPDLYKYIFLILRELN